MLGVLARSSPSWCDNVRLLDSTPVPCASSRETVKRSDFAGYASYGYCASHSRYFWGFRLMLLCAPDGMPIAFDLFPANMPERDAAAEILKRVELDGYTIIADKGFAGADFEQLVQTLGARLLRPDRNNEPHRHGSLGPIRQWIESIIDTLKGQLSLEDHGAHTCKASPSASRNDCSRSPPACGTTNRSINQAATSPLRPLTETVGSAGGAGARAA